MTPRDTAPASATLRWPMWSGCRPRAAWRWCSPTSTPSTAERGIGDATLRAAAGVLPADCSPLLYARVDLVPAANGTPGLLELELCEPSVFLAHAAASADRFAAAIARC